MIKCVFFDLGNTLIDMSVNYSKAADLEDLHRLEEIGVHISLKKLRETVLETEKYIEKNYRDNSKRHRHGFFFYITCKLLNKKISLRKAAMLSKITRKNLLIKYKLVPNAINVLKKLRSLGLKTVLIANSSRKKANENIDRFKLRGFFDSIIVSQNVGNEKSSGVPYKLALKKNKFKPNEVIMVGDRIDQDIIGAKMVGIKAIKFNFGYWNKRYYGKKVIPDFSVNNLNRVVDIVGMLNK